MPEFDTYHAIERFAQDNTSVEALQAYLFLRKRTERAIRWRALREADSFGLKKAIEIYTGTKEHNVTPTKLEDMTEKQRQDLFVQACAETGVQIDPSLFKN